ncbi:uncharacterized protein LOC129331067 [Eublepharis macularius]|uniref:Uncharacterized protein LOC129331067 n=1 Tax=Eublepharis macularius TaxID=481883 RepID=A0AA97JI29_EUBMA|nr:uncharacterized protein LOC129331067 [Eublepharis macularius]
MVPMNVNRQKRDHIVWTDLIFRIPLHKPKTEVPKKEARCNTSVAAISNLQLGKKNRQMKPLHLRMDSVQEEETEEVKESSPPQSHAVSAPSSPGNLASQGKVKRVLVDLRPILENVMDPFEEGPEERDLENDTLPSSYPRDSSRKVTDPSSEAEEKDSTNNGCSSSNARESSSEDHETETTTMDSGDGESDQDSLLPPSVDPCRDFSLAANNSRTPKDICWSPDETTALGRNDWPAVQPTQPKLKIPKSFPKITPHWPGLPEADSTTDLVRPSPPSPDFQLPTQLLLQRLQETTTSKNHLLIMQVLRSLREELPTENLDSDDGDKGNHLTELPTGNLQKHNKPQARTRKPAAPKRRLGKLVWCSSSSVHAADSGQKALNVPGAAELGK